MDEYLKGLNERIRRLQEEENVTQLHGYHVGWQNRLELKKPFLSAADLVMLREMKISLVPPGGLTRE